MSIDDPTLETRPLTARSVIASNLLGMDPPELPVRALVESGRLHGLSSGSIRTALSRLVAMGDAEITNSDSGPRYRLAGSLLERQQRQVQSRKHLGVSHEWDGTWRLAIVHPDARSAADRAALRAAAVRFGLAEFREGIWGRPDNLDNRRAPRARAIVDSQCTIVIGAVPVDTQDWVESFTPKQWAKGAKTIMDTIAKHQRALDELDVTVLPESFLIAAAGVRHVASDPRLPEELLPKRWPGNALRAAVEQFEDAYKRTWLAWYRSLDA